MSDDEATFRELGTGQYFTEGSGDPLAKTNVIVSIVADDVIKLSKRTDHQIEIDGTTIILPIIEEGVKEITFVESNVAAFFVPLNYDYFNEQMFVTIPQEWSGSYDYDVNGDLAMGVSKEGTYYFYDFGSYDLELYFSPTGRSYNFDFEPPWNVISTSSTGEGHS